MREIEAEMAALLGQADLSESFIGNQGDLVA